MNYRCLLALPSLSLILAALLTGCSQSASQNNGPELPALPVSKPVQKNVTDYVDFTGRNRCQEAVDIRRG